MNAEAAALDPTRTQEPFFKVGQPFVSPLFDYALIGGGLSLLFVGFLAALDRAGFAHLLSLDAGTLAAVILLSNSAHFAASTVRLYTKPGAYRDLPFLTMGFPLITILVLTLSLYFYQSIGRHLNALYLTWSPYHYAAQAYGLSVMYGYRSGCKLELADKQLMRATCLIPFLWAFTRGSNSGLGWFVPDSLYTDFPLLRSFVDHLSRLLAVLTFAAPALLVWRLKFSRSLTLPAISLLLIVSNGIWWITFTYADAFIWATVFHGIQYIAIVTIFHVKDHNTEPAPYGIDGTLFHTLSFYAMCVALGYFLFNVWPHAYASVGFGWAESQLLVAAVINVHHFIVDGYIWKLRKDPNFRVVTSGV